VSWSVAVRVLWALIEATRRLRVRMRDRQETNKECIVEERVGMSGGVCRVVLLASASDT